MPERLGMIAITRRAALQFGLLCLAMPAAMAQQKPITPDWRTKLVEAAREQIGVTTLYDPTYTRWPIRAGMSSQSGVCARTL